MERYKSVYSKEWTTLPKGKLEELSLPAFSKGLMSDFTQYWRKERNKDVGTEQDVAKLMDVVVSRAKGFVTFIFFTTPTTPEDEVMTSRPKKHMMLLKDTVYQMDIRVMDFFKYASTYPGFKSAGELTRDQLREILEVADVKVFCNCPSYHWQGMNWVCSQFNASIHPTDIEPKDWRTRALRGKPGDDKVPVGAIHNDFNFTCKHLGGLMNQIKFELRPMASMLTSVLRGGVAGTKGKRTIKRR